MLWTSRRNRTILRLALEEDSARRDVTTLTLIPASLRIEAEIRAQQRGVVCGLPLAKAFLRVLDPKATFQVRAKEGQKVQPNQVLAVIRGKARAVLSAERPALNILQHLSGIATYTNQQVRRVQNRKVWIYDTRKTLPGLRELEKYAVRCGGGKNHRMSLESGLLIKDNHLKVCRLAGVDWIKPVKKLVKQSPGLAIEMEVQTQRDLTEAFLFHPKQVLLDNLPPWQLKKMIQALRRRLPNVEIEISGGIQPVEIPALSKLDVDRISMGKLTHSAPALDINLEIIRVIHAR